MVSIGGYQRLPFFTGTAGDMAGKTNMIAGDLFYTTDTKLNYCYSGTAWVLIANISASAGASVKLLASSVKAVASTSFSFTGLTTTDYSTIKIYCCGQGAAAGTQAALQFNGDTGNNYDYSYSRDGAAATTATGQTSMRIGFHMDNEVNSNDYTISNAAGINHSASCSSGATGALQVGGGTWKSSAAITRIDIIASQNFSIGSACYVYGVLKA